MKRILKIFTIPILMGIFFYFHSCQKETLEPTAQKKIQLETINHKQLVNDSQINYSLPVIESHFDIVTHTKDNYDKLTILTDKVIKITAGETVSYTFNLENTYHNGSDFQNLLVKKFNNQISYYIVLYKRNEENTDKPFKTKIVNIDDDILELDKLFLDDKKDLLTVAPDETTGGGWSDCDPEIYYEACYLPNGGRGGADGHAPTCQHEGKPHASWCDLMCSGSTTIYDFSNCFTSNYTPIKNDVPDASSGGSSSGGGGGSESTNTSTDTSGDYTLTSPIGADGITQEDCPEGYIKDPNNICIKIYKPCSTIKTLITNPNVAQKIESLNKPEVFNQKFESGLTQNKNGIFTALVTAPSTNNSMSLIFNVTEDTQGYIHAHTNDYEDGTYDANGNPRIKQPIRMFSPNDVNSLMLMASHITDGDYSQIYGIMLSSSGNYIIKFNGTSADIKTGFKTEKWRKSFEQYKIDNEYWSNEKLFLRFLSEKMQVQGVSLFKIKKDGTTEEKTLDATNKVTTKKCP